MKRFCFLIIMSFVLQIFCFAQTAGGVVKRPSNKKYTHSLETNSKGIKRTIGGVVLGKTTKQEVVAMLKKKGYSLNYDNFDGTPIVYVHQNVYYGGYLWNGLNYYFHDNIVFQIKYSIFVEKGSDTSSIENGFSKIETSLLKKYSTYKTQGIPYPGSQTSFFRDEKTKVEISKGESKNICYLSLEYKDIRLYERLLKNSVDVF